VIDLFRRLAQGLVPSAAASAPMDDYEAGSIIDGAELTEMDCRWSPSMGLLPQGTFEETHPQAQVRSPGVR
jgi:hypothetical protein